MHVYEPTSWEVLVAVLAAAALLLAFGFALQRNGNRAVAWLTLVATIAATDRGLASEAAGFRMLALMGIAAFACKAIVGVEARASGRPALPPGRWLLFAGAWLGMQPRPFERRRVAVRAYGLLARSVVCVAGGAGWFVLVREAHARWPQADYAWALLIVPALSMVLHFGWIGMTAAALRAAGFAVEPQFRAPWRAQGLREFWAKRWNVAFSHLTTIAVCRPSERLVGRRGATALGFFASGLLHELACSLPVGTGYGLPTTYFLLQALGVLTEDALTRRGMLLPGWRARAWTFAWVLLPVPLVFHPPFVRGVLQPLL